MHTESPHLLRADGRKTVEDGPGAAGLRSIGFKVLTGSPVIVWTVDRQLLRSVPRGTDELKWYHVSYAPVFNKAGAVFVFKEEQPCRTRNLFTLQPRSITLRAIHTSDTVTQPLPAIQLQDIAVCRDAM